MTKGKFPNGLREAMEAKDIGPTELGRLIEEPKQNVDRWRNGERRLTPEMAAKIAPHVGVSANRLLLLERSPALADLAQTIGSAIRQARRQRGVVIRQIAEAAGAEVPTVEAWEAGRTMPGADHLIAIAEVLKIDGLALGRGEIEPIGDDPMGNATFISDSLPLHAGPRDVEKLGVVAAGEEGDFEFNGAVAEYVQRPRGLVGRPGVFALELISDSMYPAYRKGDIVFCDKTVPEVGDDIVIETFPDEGAKVGKSFIKRLKRRSKSALVVEQFNPTKDLTFDPYAIKHLWRVVPNRELHGY